MLQYDTGSGQNSLQSFQVVMDINLALSKKQIANIPHKNLTNLKLADFVGLHHKWLR